MKFFFFLTSGLALTVTPVQKVTQMLNNMAAKGKEEKQDEEVRFSTFQQWCSNTSQDRQRAIEEGSARMEQFAADEQKATSDANMLGKAIAELQNDIGTWSGDKKSAAEVRAKEHQDFQATHQDYSESIDAIQRAIIVLKRQTFDRQQASLVQTHLQAVAHLKTLSFKDRGAIASFLEKDAENPDFLNRSAPAANAYEFQSGGVIDLLQKLLDNFVDEKRSLEREEANTRHSFEMLTQELTDQVETATAEVNDRAVQKAKREQDAAEAKGDLADTTAVRNEDQKYLDDLSAECRQKTTDFENRQKLRAEELDAIQKAVEILSSKAVAGNAQTYLPTFVQTRTAHVFLQLRASNPLQQRVASFLSQRAAESNSRILSMMATKVADDPFDKVKKMIGDLIIRLQEEATQETEHKGWCDAELATNKQTREQKQAEVETLQARVEGLQAKIAQLGQEIADLTQAVANLTQSMAEATENRNTDKTKNEQTIADAKEAQVAISQALAVLREFYAKAGTATSLLQGPADDAPETFSASYQGMQSESGGVVGMIEVIQSDFARLESETSASESESAREYQQFMNDSEQDKAVKHTESNHRAHAKQQKESALNASKKDLAGSQEELDAAMQYYDKLKPSCVDAGVSYEDRVARREEEIQSLKEALNILSGEDIA